MGHTAKQRPSMAVSAVRNGAVGFKEELDSGELLTGTPTVTVSPTGPTISNVAVSTAALTIDGESHAIGEAVQFKVLGVTARVTYTFTVTCGTDATPAQTLIGSILMDGEAD